MKKKYIIIPAIIVVVALIVGILAFCSLQEKDPAEISPEGKQEHDVIIGDEDLDEEYHVIDEYIEEDADDDTPANNKTNTGTQAPNKNTTTGNGSVGNATDDDEDENGDEVGDEGDDSGEGDNTENDNTGDGEQEEPSTGLETSEDANGDWGKIEF